MTIEQTIEVPASRRIFLEVPREVPVGKAKLIYASFSADEDTSITRSDELRIKLQNLKGSLGKNAFGTLDGVAYQRQVREEWNS